MTTLTQVSAAKLAQFVNTPRLFLFTMKSVVNCSRGFRFCDHEKSNTTRPALVPRSLTRQIKVPGRHLSASVRRISTRRQRFFGTTTDLVLGRGFAQEANRLWRTASGQVRSTCGIFSEVMSALVIATHFTHRVSWIEQFVQLLSQEEHSEQH